LIGDRGEFPLNRGDLPVENHSQLAKFQNYQGNFSIWGQKTVFPAQPQPMYHSHSKTERQVGGNRAVIQFSTGDNPMPVPSVDLRQHARHTKKRLVLAGLGLIFIVGTVLIAATYGTPAAGCGLAFFLAAMVPVTLVILVLYFLQWLADRIKNGDSREG
jgi:hypothetical protein